MGRVGASIKAISQKVFVGLDRPYLFFLELVVISLYLPVPEHCQPLLSSYQRVGASSDFCRSDHFLSPGENERNLELCNDSSTHND